MPRNSHLFSIERNDIHQNSHHFFTDEQQMEVHEARVFASQKERESRSKATNKVYNQYQKQFMNWCDSKGFPESTK